MSGTGGEDKPAVAEALPDRAAEPRDLLGNACFYLHFAVLIYIVIGWAAPVRAALYLYLAAVPAIALQWQCNRNSCVLNNLESLIRTGRWRSAANREEGAWLLTLATSVIGYPFQAWQIDLFTYAVLVLLWLAGLGHLLWRTP